jgi:predicted RNase H-like HicB family nuclease
MARYTVLLYAADEGGYIATVPALNATTEGESIEEDIERARDVIEGAIATEAQLGRDIPIEPAAPVIVSLDVDVERAIAAQPVPA